MLGDMGLGFAFAYYAAREKDRISDLWTLAWLVGGIVGCSLAVFGWFILPLYVAPLRLAARVSFELSLLAIPLVLINGYQAYLLLGVGFVADNSLIRMASGLCYAVSALLLAILDVRSIESFTQAYLLAQFVALIISTWLTVRRFRPRFRLSSDLLPVLFRFGLKTQFASIASQANLQGRPGCYELHPVTGADWAICSGCSCKRHSESFSHGIGCCHPPTGKQHA